MGAMDGTAVAFLLSGCVAGIVLIVGFLAWAWTSCCRYAADVEKARTDAQKGHSEGGTQGMA